MHPYTAAPPAARLLLVVSAVLWLVMELRESTNRRPEATESDAGSRQYIRIASIVGILGAVVITRNVSSGRINPDVAWVGLVVVWCGIALRFWSFRALGRYFTFTVQTSPDQPVISSGPYRFVRHPSYAAILLIVMGVGTLPRLLVVVRLAHGQRVVRNALPDPRGGARPPPAARRSLRHLRRQPQAAGAFYLVAQSGDGRDVMTRPVGGMKVSSSLAFPVKDQPELCTRW